MSKIGSIARDNKGWKLSGLRAHLVSLRTQFGYTDEQVAAEAGYNLAAFRSWERGFVEPPLSAVVNWCLVFNHRLCMRDFNRFTPCEDVKAHTEAT